MARAVDKGDDLVRSGLELARKGFVKQALEEFEKARTISPDNLDNLLNLGFMHTIQGNFKTAFDAYAQVSVKHPDEPLAKLALGNLYWLGGQADKAIGQWKQMKGDCKPNPDYNILRHSENLAENVCQPLRMVTPTQTWAWYIFSQET